MIHWPAVISYQGDDELNYVASLAAWQADPHLPNFTFEADDVLIDSRGQVFKLADRICGEAKAAAVISLDEFVELLRKHVSAMGNCCASKLGFSTFAEGMDLLRQLGSN